MRPIRTLMGAAVAGTLLFFAGCTDAPIAPFEPTSEPSYGLLSDLLSGGDTGDTVVGDDVSVLRRSRPLADDEVVAESIGYYGGTIRLPEAGLTLYVPRGALRERTDITVTAPAGDLVGYHFEPHGLEFRKKVRVTQDLSLTDVVSNLLSPGALSAVYFEGELEPEVTALETLTLWLLRSLGVFHIEHFSGYVIATN